MKPFNPHSQVQRREEGAPAPSYDSLKVIYICKNNHRQITYFSKEIKIIPKKIYCNKCLEYSYKKED